MNKWNALFAALCVACITVLQVFLEEPIAKHVWSGIFLLLLFLALAAGQPPRPRRRDEE